MKINLLFIIDGLKEVGGGTERHLLNFLVRVNREKCNITVCTFNADNGPTVQKIKDLGFDLIHLPVDRFYGINAFIRSLKLIKLIKQSKINVVQTFHFKSDTYGVFVSKIAGVKAIISSKRDINDLKKSRQLLVSRLCNHFINHFIVNCKAVRNAVMETEKIPLSKTTLIYNGVDLEKFRCQINGKSNALKKNLGINEDDFVIGSVAIFRPEKAYHIFFEGIEKVKMKLKNLCVLVLGDGILRQRFEIYCKEKNLCNVKFIGSVSNVERYIELMDVLCLVPNKNEGFSNSILEGMAMGKPIIASNIGGNAEAVIDGKTGMIIPSNDSTSLAEAIVKLYHDPDLKKRMGEMGKRRIKEYFNLEKMVQQMENLFEKFVTNQYK